MSRLYRVRPASQGGPAAVQHPEHGGYVVPNPAHIYSSEDELVRAYPWLFVADSEIESSVEQATNAPGEKRTYNRRNR